MKKLFTFLLPLVLFSSCGSSSDSSEQTVPVQEYPELEQLLVEEDFNGLSVALTQLRSLPKKDSIFFQSLIRQDILKELVQMDFDEAFPLYLDYVSMYNSTYNLYLESDGIFGDYSTEIIYMMPAFMVQSAVGANLAEAFVLRLDPNDSSYEIRMDGLAQMRLGQYQILKGVLMTLAEKGWKQEDLLYLFDALVSYYPEIYPDLTPEHQKDLRQEILSLIQETDLYDASKLQELLAL